MAGPVECGLVGAVPTAKAGTCIGYFRRIAFLTSVTLIAAPSSSNGSYVRPSPRQAYATQRPQNPKDERSRA